MTHSQHHPQRGFTLLEILVALTVLAIALSASLAAVSQYTKQVAELKQRTVAHWIAMNEITRLRVTEAWSNSGSKRGKQSMANTDWAWQYTITKPPGLDTSKVDMRQVTIEVTLDGEEKILATLTGYLGNPNSSP